MGCSWIAIAICILFINNISSSTAALDSESSAPILAFRETNYSALNQNVTYRSTQAGSFKGMAPLYNITNLILDFFLGDEPIVDGYIEVSDMNITFGPKVRDQDWLDLGKHYWLIFLVVFIAAIIIVLMPIIGLCVCCCRCAGACGGRSQPFDKKHDTCRRFFLGIFMIVIATGLIFNVIIAFATNYLLQQGVQNATNVARYGVSDAQVFLKSTSAQSNHILVKNYDELAVHLEAMLQDTANVVIDKLEEQSKAVSLTQLATFVETLPKMKINLNRMKEITNGLRVNASQLSDGLRGVKRELLTSLTKCKSKSCKDILEKYEIGKLDMNGIDYDQLPDVSSTIDSVNNLISEEVIDSVSKGHQVLEQMRFKLNETIYEHIPQVTNSIRKAGIAMRDISTEISRTLGRVSEASAVTKHLDTADYYIKEYYIYVYYALLGVSATLLLILMCVVCGLLCGICGKRPDGYGDDCCNKGAGSRFLILGVTVTFLTISVLLAVGVVIFLGGLILHRGVCVPLENPNDDQVFHHVDKLIDLNKLIYQKAKPRSQNTEPLRISKVIDSCRKNQTVYKVLKLHNYFDINEILTYPQRFDIDIQLQELINNAEIESNIEILSPEAEEAIDKLAQSELKNFALYKFTDNLNTEIIKYNLDDIAIKLTDTANDIPPNSEFSDVRTSLKNQALHLSTYQQNLVTPMTTQTREILDLATDLDRTLKFNRDSFEEALHDFVAETKAAQEFINKEGTEFVRKVARELVTGFKDEINNYLNLVVNQTENDLGRCGPLANVYESVRSTGCNRIVNPLNGFWSGLICCILIFLPMMIFSLKLSTLYQKSDPYPGPLVESEYFYDAYSERDNIPLANGPKNKRRKKNDRRLTSRDRRAEYYEDSGSPRHEAPREARYNDMAPKHWDGGPPRYQNPPIAPPASEYERPPPYYFPGASSEHD